MTIKLSKSLKNYFGQVILAVIAFVIIQFFLEAENPSTTSPAATPTPSAESIALQDSPAPTTSPSSSSQITPATTSTQLYQVTSVTDGDTIKVEIDGNIATVRIVGINTPETVDPRKPVECFGKEATEKMKALVLNQRVKLESDPTQSDRDRYNRLLRFVFLEDGTDVGLTLIREGYAEESLYSEVPHRYYESYVAAQTEAQSARRGLWSTQNCPS